MILVFVYHDTGGCGEEDPRPDVIKNFHYMYFALFITLLTAAAAIIISLLTEKPAEKHVSNLINVSANSKTFNMSINPYSLAKAFRVR